MLEYPALHIVLFIAMSLCPDGVGSFEIRGLETVITATKADDEWRVNGSEISWCKEGTKVSKTQPGEDQIRDVGKFVGNEIKKFDWEERDSYINNFLRIEKSEERRFKVVFEPKGRKAETYFVDYKPVGK